VGHNSFRFQPFINFHLNLLPLLILKKKKKILEVSHGAWPIQVLHQRQHRPQGRIQKF